MLRGLLASARSLIVRGVVMQPARKLVRRWSAVVALVLALTAAHPVAAVAVDHLPTDAAVVAGDFTQEGDGAGGWLNQGWMTFYVHNYGPNTLQEASWWLEFTAPAGTQFDTVRQFHDCITVVALTHYRCSEGQVFVDDPANYEGVCCNRITITLTIVGPVTSPARVTAEYDADTNSSDDTATMTIHPHDVSPTPPPTTSAPGGGSGGGTPPSAPTPNASHRSSAPVRPSAFSSASTPAADGSPGATGAPDASAGGARAVLPSASPWLASGSHSGGGALVFWIVVAVVFVGAAAAGSLYLVRCRAGVSPG